MNFRGLMVVQVGRLWSPSDQNLPTYAGTTRRHPSQSRRGLVASGGLVETCDKRLALQRDGDGHVALPVADADAVSVTLEERHRVVDGAAGQSAALVVPYRFTGTNSSANEVDLRVRD